MFLQNSLQATGKLRAIYLSQEEKRVDTEQQLRSWVSKVETQIGDEGKKTLNAKRWTISRLEPVVTTGMPAETNTSSTASNGDFSSVASNFGNVFAMEDYFSSEKPIEVLMASTCPQLIPSGNPQSSSPAPALTASVRSTSALASIGMTPSGLSGAVAKGTSSSSIPVGTHHSGSHLHAASTPSVPTSTGSQSLTSSPVVGNHARVPSKEGAPALPSSAPPSTTNTTDASKTAAANTSANNPQPSFMHIVVEVNDLIMLVGQDAVLTFSLYADDKFITEEFPIVLPNTSPIVLEDKAKRVVFRDLPIELLNGGSTVYLLAKIVRFGKMKYNEAKPSAKDSHEGYPVRRPYAVAVMALNEVLSNAQAEQDVADALAFSPDETLAAAKMATLRRRQFSSAPRPTLKDDFYDPSSGQSSSKHSKGSTPFSSSNRPTSPPRNASPGGGNRGKIMKDTLRSSAYRAQAQAIDSLDMGNLASIRSMGHVRATDKFMTLYAPTPSKDEIFPDIHSYIINSLNDKSHYLTFLPKAKGLLVHVSKFEGSFASIMTHPSFLKMAPITVCQTLFLPDQTSSSSTSSTSSIGASTNSAQGQSSTGTTSSANSDLGFNFAPRNDLYITIEEALLHDDKSFEILVEARNKFGNPAAVSSSSAQSISSAASPLSILNTTGTSSNNLLSGANLSASAVASSPATIPCPALPLWANPPSVQGLPVSPFSAFQPAHIVHRCIPYHHKKDPKPMETFKMDLSRFSDVDHLYMTIRHIGESGKASDPIAFGTLRLYQQDASFIPNGTRKLNTYKYGASSSSSSTSADLAAKRGTLMSSNASSGSSPTMPLGNAYTSTSSLLATKTGSGMISRAALGAVDDGQVAAYLKNEDQLPRSNKSDHIVVSVNLVSTKITENIPLRALLNWQNSTAPDMSPLLEKCAHISRKDIVNFYKDIFDTLLELLVLLDDVRASAFQTLLAILATCQSDPRNAWYDQLDPRGHASLKHWVDKYLEEGGMSNGKVWPILMDSLHKLIAAVSTDPKGNHKTLKLALKAAPMLIKFILRSRQLALLNSSSTPSLPDYTASGTGPRGAKSVDYGSKGPSARTKMSPVVSAASTARGVSPTVPALTVPNSQPNTSTTDSGPSECFASHGFEAKPSTGPDAAKDTSFDSKQVSFNPLYNLPQVKMQGLFNMLGDDTNFRKRFLALLESFSSLLMINEPSLITMQALLVKAVPQMLQSAVYVLDKDTSSRFIERFLTALDDADQLQLNIEKLLFLEHFQFSPYISLSVLIKHIKMHARESEEERFIALRILKSMIRSILSQVFLGSLSATSPIANLEAHPEDEMDAEYTSAALLSSSARGDSSPKNLMAASNEIKNGSSSSIGSATASTNSTSHTSVTSIFPPDKSGSSLSDSRGSNSGLDKKARRASKSPRHSMQLNASSTPSRPLFLVLLDLVPTLSRVMRKADESDSETRRDVVTIFLALLKIVSLTRLRQHLKNIKTKHTKSLLDALANIVLLSLKLPVYPLGWSDLCLYQLRRITLLLQHVLIPVVVQNFGGYPWVLTDMESKIWTRLFCVVCYALRHPAIQIESYVANRDAVISYLGGQDPRVVLARGLWALWNRFEPFRLQLVPNAVPALLALSSAPNLALAKLARRCYLSLVTREAQIVNWMNAPHVHKIYRTVASLAPNRPRVSSSSSTGASQGIPIRMVGSGSNSSLSGSPTGSPRTGTSPSNSSSYLLSGEIAGETTRARSNNASASGAPRPAPPKRSASPIISSGSSGSLASHSRPNVTVSSGQASTTNASGASSSGSRLSDPHTSSDRDIGVVPNLGLGGMSSSTDLPIQTLNSFGSAYSFSSTNASAEKISFPRIEVATIQALEELSKSGAWSQKHFEAFFSVCRDVASAAMAKTPSSGTPTTTATRPSPRSASASQNAQIAAATLEQLYASQPPHPKALFVDADSPLSKVLPRPLVDAMSDKWADTAELKFELPNLASKVVEFSTDMTSLVLLLASMRDLPQGAEYDEERAYALTQLMTYLRQTQHADAYLKYAYKLSKMYEEAGQYTEAAYAVLLHAEMLDWSDRILPPMFAYAAVSASTRKQQLFCQAIALFDRGKAWENAIKVSSDLCLALRAPLYDYHELAAQLRVQADLYIKIAEQERFFSNYFYVAYYGTGFPNALRRKKFIYRGLELERIPHFISRMSKKFPNAKIITSMDPTPSELNERRGSNSTTPGAKGDANANPTSGGGQYLQIFTVQPSNEAEMASGGTLSTRGADSYNSSSGTPGITGSASQFLGNMPEGTRKYHAANNVRVFQYSRPFKQPGAPKTTDENAFEHVWSAQVFVVTEDTFPNLQRRLEIVQGSEVVRSPIENATLAVATKNAELGDIVAKLAASSSLAQSNSSASSSDTKVDRLSMALNGILDAAVNGGTAKYRGAFLSPKFIDDAKANKKLLEHIYDLQKVLMNQMQVVARGLALHAELCPSTLLGLQKRLESQYERMVEATTQAASRSALGDASDHIASPTAHTAHHAPSHSTSGSAPHSQLPHLPPAKLPPGGMPKGAMRVKDSDARPSVMGLAQRMSNHEQGPQ